MKKKILAFAALIIFSASTAFAGNYDIDKKVQSAFNSSFGHATNISWQNNNSYYTASFQLDGLYYHALYATDAEMIAVSRNILSTELPARLEAILRNNFSVYWVSDLVKYDISGQAKYYATVENAGKKTILESIGGEEWSVLRETVK
jgi:hypothetical protein